MSRVAIWIIAVAAALVALASLWLAGEMRERNCLQRVTLYQQDDSIWGGMARERYGVSTGHCGRLPF